MDTESVAVIGVLVLKLVPQGPPGKYGVNVDLSNMTLEQAKLLCEQAAVACQKEINKSKIVLPTLVPPKLLT